MRIASNSELNKLRQILKILRKDPEVFPKLKIGTILKDEQLDQSYEDWLRLLSKFDRYHEKEFFSPYWVPICFDEFVFVDVSQENWCIFEACYNCWEDDVDDHYWYKNHFFIDMEDLLNNAGDFHYLKKARNQNRDQRQNNVENWLENLPNELSSLMADSNKYIAADGLQLARSWELLVYERLVKAGFKPRYSEKLELEHGIQKEPAFSFIHEDTGEQFYWFMWSENQINRFNTFLDLEYSIFQLNRIPLFDDPADGTHGIISKATLIISLEKEGQIEILSNCNEIAKRNIDYIFEKVLI